jgi:two-component system, LuxR family, sensor kinase FixL
MANAAAWLSTFLEKALVRRSEPSHLVRYRHGHWVPQTSRRRLQKAQAELTHMARVTLMGELTASIAHEVSQPLAAIVTNGDACLHWLSGAEPSLEKARAALEQILAEGHRAGNVIQKSRSFTDKRPPVQRSTLDLRELIDDVVTLMRDEVARRAVSLQTQVAANIPLPLITGRR